ncbi:BamA/TamA family outer membrane protein [Aurantibacter crassamenti]|uniref:translocation and assembly module lipoprotein TamL n=1 Tax=Aurantibacter crassamenti TaxID=1837375 RepID=UPI001939326A|nr:BamA/TamA family outer membrane protein [Aurantibacter crassamenti]MBM1108087.1 BamA/TamA family outer membrane protein [Aurantibacter crassamenti]
MWHPLCSRDNIAKISLLFLAIVLASCNTLKRVDDNELLITKNTIYVDSLKIGNEDINSLLVQKPNSALLGYPLRLNLYNLAKKNPDSSFQTWLHKNDKREQRLNKLLSKKQVRRLGESFLVKGVNDWLKKIGEPPAILDTTQSQRSLTRLNAYYHSKGYFNNTGNFTIDSLPKKKRIGVNYNINLGKPYMIDTLSQKISSPALDSIYRLHTSNSYVVPGEKFDIDNFNNERERLTTLFRNTGIYNFQESSISYTIERDTAVAKDDQGMEIQLNIDDLRRRGEGATTTSKYEVHRFKDINIHTDYDFNSTATEKFIRYEDYTIYYRGKLRFKPKTLANAIFFKTDSIYRDIDRVRTYRQIANLNVFRYPTISYAQDPNKPTDLTANIYLQARPKYSLGSDFDINHSNIQRVGLAYSPSLQARNIFKGAENLSLTGRLSIGNSRDESISDKQFFNILEFGADLNLNFPRIWLPFINTDKIIPSYTLPRTRMSIGATAQQNIGLDKQTFNTVLGYNWTPSDLKKHNLELLNVQFVRNVNQERFFNVYTNSFSTLNDIATDDSSFDYRAVAPELFESPDGTNDPNLLIPDGANEFISQIENGTLNSTTEDFIDVNRIKERRDRLTQNNLIFASNYTFNLTNRSDVTDNQFYSFRFKVESAGNLLSGLSYLFPFNEDDNGNLLVFNVPYSQYIKTEFDYVKYWDLTKSQVIALRTFFGIAVPYGNADNIPFVRSYFAGGSNDIRAWTPYSLGPGRVDAINDFNEANLKIAASLEYRFPIVGDINGALFADAGNIWNVFDNVEDPDATFNGISSLADIALGTGFGVRYDFTYFLFRLDLGFKTYNPAEEVSKRWFRDYNFANSVLQIGINYPF